MWSFPIIHFLLCCWSILISFLTFPIHWISLFDKASTVLVMLIKAAHWFSFYHLLPLLSTKTIEIFCSFVLLASCLLFSFLLLVSYCFNVFLLRCATLSLLSFFFPKIFCIPTSQSRDVLCLRLICSDLFVSFFKPPWFPFVVHQFIVCFPIDCF